MITFYYILGDGIIKKEELEKFYRTISGITDPVILQKTTNEGYRALTAVSSLYINEINLNYK